MVNMDFLDQGGWKCTLECWTGENGIEDDDMAESIFGRREEGEKGSKNHKSERFENKNKKCVLERVS